MAISIRRRDAVKLAAGAATLPLTGAFAARAQQGERVRRIGIFSGPSENDPTVQARLAVFRKALLALGWVEGRNIRLDYRYGTSNPERARTEAAELVALSPDVILSTPPALRPLLEVTRIIPIVFVLAIDPVGDGSVASLARPGGSVTGFASAEPANATKYVEVLKEIAPHTTRMTYIHNPLVPGINKMVDEFVAAARSFGVEAKGVAVRDGADIERSIEALAQEPNGALMVPSSPGITEHLDLIVALASRHRLPTIGSFRFFPARGGLMSWGTDDLDQFRSAASYVDRILKGAKPADLPVQYPTKYAMVINLKAAKAIGLTIPESFLLRADEVIE